MKARGVVLTAWLSPAFLSDAAARNPTGRQRTGTIEHGNFHTQHLVFRADREGKADTYVWNKRTRFVWGLSFIEASALRSGERAAVTVHSPLFGAPFVSRARLLQPAPAAHSRR